MLTYIKGNPESLEGKALVFVPNKNDEPFESEIGPVYPALNLTLTLFGNKILDIRKTSLVSQYLIENPELYNGDIVKGDKLTNEKELFTLLERTADSYTNLFRAQQSRLEQRTRKYGVKFNHPRKLTREEYSAVMEKVTAVILGEVLLSQGPLDSLKDLLYLSKDQPFEEKSKLVYSFAKEIRSLNNGSKDDLIKLLALNLLQIECIINRNFERAAEISKEIVDLEK